MSELYLRKEGEFDYVLYYFGKNGEPKQGESVQMHFRTDKGSGVAPGRTLPTDKQGRIFLKNCRNLVHL